jgi:tetratricopeptide (TPR) repeat protein
MRLPGGAAWGEWLARVPLAGVLLAAVALSFLNPFGWRALWQPFEYLLTWRNESIYRNIPELAPLAQTWRLHLRSGLPILFALWPLLVLWRPRGRRFDAVEAMTCGLFTAQALLNQRLAGFLVVAAAPYLARDLSAWAGVVRWPAWCARPSPRAGLVAAACVLACIPEWRRPELPFGIGFVQTYLPGPACDFIARHGLRGRIFNPPYFGGYLLWRFWPERDRLPFMDVHQSGTPADRDLYAHALSDPGAWRELERRHRFDIALIDGHQDWMMGYRLPDFLDADPDWALVFRDDAAMIYLRRGGALAAAAESLAFDPVLPGGNEAFVALGPRARSDLAFRARLRAALERMAASSPLEAIAQSHLANLDYLEGDAAGARRHLEAALRVEPRLAGARRRLGSLALAEGRPAEAIREFERELALGGPPADEYERMGEAWERLGDRNRAIRCYRREVGIHAMNEGARAALRRLEGSR